MSRQYVSAGNIVQKVLIDRATLMTACNKGRVGTIDYALACETLKYASVIKEIMNRAQITMKKLNVGHEGILYVMIYEFLFGKGKVSGGGAVKRAIIPHIQSFKDILTDMMKDKGVNSHHLLLAESIQHHTVMPRYLRINEIKLSIAEGVEAIRSGFNASECVVDDHVPSLVKVTNNIPNLGNHPLVKNGCLIIQDKASCFPSQILMDQWDGGDIIDACAAPGNKTSHMASLLHSKFTQQDPIFKIFAFEKDPKRCKLLRRRMTEAGAACVEAINQDFLSVDINSDRYRNVASVLVDPSCSGSGIIRSLDRLVATPVSFDDRDRLKQLQLFQISVIRKAMSFPNVKTVVYSTCSIHEAENEEVVATILSSDDIGCNWELSKPERLANWPRRGLPFRGLTPLQAQSLLRCSTSDGMNGFFVALFKKKDKNSVIDRQSFDDERCCNQNVFSDNRKRRCNQISYWQPLSRRKYF